MRNFICFIFFGSFFLFTVLVNWLKVNFSQNLRWGLQPPQPPSLYRPAIVSAIAPAPSAETMAALENSKEKRKEVEASFGEVLMCDVVIERLTIEKEERVAKKSKSGGFKG